ncbi:MAG: hypothetical protein NZM29_08810, partial [Nitrospira sp.]|nr:hypothetical protein [Nitrospira sp.]
MAPQDFASGNSSVKTLDSQIDENISQNACNNTYAFDNLLPGVYVVVETDPAGYISTADTDGPNDNRIVVDVTTVAESNG